MDGDDLYRTGNPIPDFYMGFYGNATVKNWSLGFSLRGEFGRQIYNNVHSNRGFFNAAGGTTGSLTNLSTHYDVTGFQTAQFLSDIYLEDADFLRLDNFYVGYNFGTCLLYTSPSPRDRTRSRMPSSA